MYEVAVEASFSASHQLRLPDGELEPLHGHDWKAEARFQGPELDECGLLVDFNEALGALKEIVQTMHHRHLNELDVFARLNPSAENVARVIFERLHAIGSFDRTLVSVRVSEAPGCVGGYSATQ
jgi:6-pyruvoyltetrahydropterin/6-carboxytetrahydropterin synthase